MSIAWPVINLPKKTERRIVTVGHGKEVWVVNSKISCPFCPNGKIWTRVPTCSTHSPIKVYIHDPHFCSQCSLRFVLHEIVAPDPAQEEADNQRRVEVLGKNHQLNIPVFDDMFRDQKRRAGQV